MADVIEIGTELPALPVAIGPYRVLGVLGRGGMGVVYRAQHAQTGQIVALKAVQIPDKEVLRSLRREVQALARIRHPGVVRVLMEGVQDGLPWYAMELLEGLTLTRFAGARTGIPSPPLVSEQPSRWEKETSADPSSVWWTHTLSRDDGLSLPSESWIAGDLLGSRALAPASGDFVPSRSTPQASSGQPVGPGVSAAFEAPDLPVLLRLMRRLCATLAYLHGEGIVHRDLKPDNILVRADGTPVLVDFGLVSEFTGPVSREELDTGNAGAGTVAFMAPEQLRGEFVDARADLYSLGCILYWLLTGRHVFPGASIREVARGHLELEPLRPSLLAPSLASGLEDLVLRLLVKERRGRLGYAEDVASDLARFGAGSANAWDGQPPPRPYLYRPSLAGRGVEIKKLLERLDRLVDSRGGVFLLGGESGVGKTRLAMELARAAERRDMLVLTGQCLPFSGSSPSGGETTGGALHAMKRPLQSLADRCRERGLAETERVLGRRGKVLALYAPSLALLPGQDNYPEPVELPPDTARLRLYSALARTLRALAENGTPLLLILDDLQWADDLSLGFLEFILQAGSFETLPVLVLGTYRSEEVGAPGHAPLQALLEAHQPPTLLLGRLDEEGVGTMVGDMLALASPAQGFIRWLARHSEGNPFFVAEYLRAAVAEGLLCRDGAGRWQMTDTVEAQDPAPLPGRVVGYENLPLPGTLRELVHRRLHALPEGAQRLSRVAAVAGRETALGLLGEMASMAEPALSEALGELVQRQVLEPGWQGRYRFVHDKIREVAYEDLEPGERTSLHRAAALALSGSEGPVPAQAGDELLASLGDHWRGAGERELAQRCYLGAARKAAAVYAQDQAERLYRAYLALVDRATPETVAVRNELAAGVLSIRGRSGDALAESRIALAEAQEIGDIRGQGSSFQEMGLALLYNGRLEEACLHFEQALALHRAAGNRLAEGDTLDNLANSHWHRGQLEEARDLFEQALVLHRDVDNRRSEATTLNNLAGIHFQQGRLDHCQALGEQALALHRAAGNRRLEGATLCNLAALHHAEGRPQPALDLYGQALLLQREAGDRRSEPHTLREIAELERRAFGRLDRAEQLVDEAERISIESANPLMRALCLCERGHLALARGLPAEKWLENARDRAAHVGEEAASPVGEALLRLRRASEAFQANRPLIQGECPDDLPAGLLRWLRSAKKT